MGVHGLWRLIEPSGKPVPLETLENKVLAVDVSIWLHQAIKGFQDSKGAPVPNAHLLGIYHRVCKLLYFKIKPVFVFDGGVPVLKRQTIIRRNQMKSKNSSEADRIQKQLLSTLMKHTAISKVLSETTKSSLTVHSKDKTDNLYALPPAGLDSTISSAEEEEATSESTDSSPTKSWDLHTIDTNSTHFKSLPVDVRHEILTELKETRKQNSWGKLHELPKQSDDFSSYQMKRLLKRQAVQAALEEAAQEMGGTSLSLAELESILKDQGIQTTTDNIGKRIASDENTRYLFIKDVKQAMENAKKDQEGRTKQTELETGESDITVITKDGLEEENQLRQAIELSLQENQSKNTMINIGEDGYGTKADMEEKKQLEQAIALSLQETASTSGGSEWKTDKFSYLDNLHDEDFDSDSEDTEECTVTKTLSSAQSYMLEYSGLTPSEISKIIEGNGKRKITKGKFLVPICEENMLEEADPLSDDIQSEELIEKSIFPVQQDANKVCSINEDKEIHIENYNELKEVTEIMSDSGESAESGDFQEVGELKEDKTSMEIVIDPNKDMEDDIFEDIFANEVISVDIATDKEEHQSNLHKEDTDIIEVNRESNSSQVKIQTVPDDGKVNNIEMKTNKDEVGVSSKSNKENDSQTTIKISKNPKGPSLTIQEMTELKDSLQRERTDLLIEQATKERLASNITDQMYQEAQELLELFGVPYIIAPMEAEAQCAFLDEIELTDGTITDDSDVWLFGGRTVYKNFFNQSKYVMEFKAENIRHNFKLNREQMILLALLVGSDYTTGIQGIGPVTALEILAAFPPAKMNEISLSHAQLISGLREFRSWFTKGKTGGISRSVLKNKLKNITFSDNFPSPQVVQAYLEPTVEDSREKFSWDKPDVVALTLFAREKFGWGSNKIDDVLKPVIKRLEENRSQKSIREYFKTKFRADSGGVNEKISKRVRTAIDRFGKSEEDLLADEMAELKKEKHRVIKRSRKNEQSKQQKSEKVNVTETEVDTESVDHLSDRSNRRTKNRKLKEPVKKTELKDTEVAIKDVEKIENKIQSRKKNRATNESDKNKFTHGIEKEVNNVTNEEKCVADNINEAVPDSVSQVDELKEYENLAAQLRIRRRKKHELIKLKQEEIPNKKSKITTLKQSVTPKPSVGASKEDIDEEIKLLIATTSKSAQREQEIKEELRRKADQELGKRSAPILRKEEVIHQRLRNRSDLLKNKLKAIEVFRKSKKGPGYVQKRGKKQILPKEDAGLSDDSDD